MNDYAVQFSDSHLIDARDSYFFSLCDNYTVYADVDGSIDVYDIIGNKLYSCSLDDDVTLTAIGTGVETDSFVAICQICDDEFQNSNQIRTYAVNDTEIRLRDSKTMDSSLNSDFYTVYPCYDRQGYYIFDLICNKIEVIDLNGSVIHSIQYKDNIVSGYPLIDDIGLRFITASDCTNLNKADLYINHYHEGKIDRQKITNFLTQENESCDSFSLIRSDNENSDCFILAAEKLYSLKGKNVNRVGETFSLEILNGGKDRSIVIKDDLAFVCDISVVPIEEIITLDVGCLEYNEELNDILVLYELMHPNIKLHIRSYYDESEFENINNLDDYKKTADKQLHKLLADLNKENASDIDILYLPYEQQCALLEQDVLVEYQPESFDEDLVFESVQRSINDEFSNRVHFPGFSIKSLAIMSKYASEYDGTFESLSAIASDHDVPLIDEFYIEDIDEWIYGGILNENISENSMNYLLEYLNENKDYKYDSECLISMPSIHSIVNYYDFFESSKDHPVMTGYPYCDDGPYIVLDNTFSVLSCSKNMIEANMFIDFLYSDISGKVEMKYGNIPSNKEAAKDYSCLDDLISVNDESIDGIPIASSDSYDAAEKARQVKKDKFLENKEEMINEYFQYIDSAKNILAYDDYLMSVIVEETYSVIQEDKSPSEATKLIMSRVRLYLDERK